MKDNHWEKALLFRSSAPRKDNSWKKAQRFRSGTVEERELLKKPASGCRYRDGKRAPKKARFWKLGFTSRSWTGLLWAMIEVTPSVEALT